jgi:predicted amidohydrolase YtcJ
MGGKIVTVDPACPEAEAVAMRGDRLIAVGSDAQIHPLVGRGTLVLELHGKLADVVVLSEDIMTVPTDEILGARVVSTIVGGKIVYSSDSSSAPALSPSPAPAPGSRH